MLGFQKEQCLFETCGCEEFTFWVVSKDEVAPRREVGTGAGASTVQVGMLRLRQSFGCGEREQLALKEISAEFPREAGNPSTS